MVDSQVPKLFSPVAWPINRRGGGKNKDTHLNTTSSKDERFPSKERPHLVILESRRVREICISVDASFFI
jgi:hypothetical protein